MSKTDTACGFCRPPADGTPEREIVDRFRDFLRDFGPPATRADIAAGCTRQRTPSELYRLRFRAWRISYFLPWEA